MLTLKYIYTNNSAAPHTYKQSLKRNACGFHFLCVWIMNTDIFSYEFCYGGSRLHGTWTLEAIVWAFSYGTKDCTDGTALNSIRDV